MIVFILINIFIQYDTVMLKDFFLTQMLFIKASITVSSSTTVFNIKINVS